MNRPETQSIIRPITRPTSPPGARAETRAADPAERVCDVLIAGAGLAGLTAAIAFARAGFDVVACGADERAGRGRTIAMLDRSIAYLDSLGLRAAIEPRAAPMRALRLIDDTGGLFPPRPVEFLSSEIGLETFGWNVENDLMADALAARAAATGGIERRPNRSRLTIFRASGRSHGSTTDARSQPGSSSAPTDALRRRVAPPASPSTPTAIRRAR